MFTGIISATGTLRQAADRDARVVIGVPREIARKLREGNSIAVNGCCLTALNIRANEFCADLAEETRTRTTLARLPGETLLNLELPLPAGAPLGGHIVQGHVDGVGHVTRLEKKAGGDYELYLAAPAALRSAMLPQGSIAVDGVSLTIAEIFSGDATVGIRCAILPHTLNATNLRGLRESDPVNLETDVLAKYAAQRAMSSTAPRITTAYLLENGY